MNAKEMLDILRSNLRSRAEHLMIQLRDDADRIEEALKSNRLSMLMAFQVRGESPSTLSSSAHVIHRMETCDDINPLISKEETGP